MSAHNKKLAQVFHYDLFGKRELKYDFLTENKLSTIHWQELNPNKPNFFFIPKNESGRDEYESGFNVENLFSKNVTGIVTMGDEFAFGETNEIIKNKIYEFKNNQITEVELKEKFNLGKNYAEFVLKNKNSLIIDVSKFIKCSYRPFDSKWTYFDNKILWRWRVEVMQHFMKGKNVGLVFKLGNAEEKSASAMVTKNIIDFRSWSRPGMQGGDYVAPLYLYPETNPQQTIEITTERTPNLNTEIVNQIAKNLGLTFTIEKETTKGTFAPIDILDYIYAVLHSPTYREKYKEFLKIDFPRVPYPKDAATFWQLVALGAEIRQIHLLESPVVEKYFTQYPINGDNVVTKPKYVSNVL